MNRTRPRHFIVTEIGPCSFCRGKANDGVVGICLKCHGSGIQEERVSLFEALAALGIHGQLPPILNQPASTWEPLPDDLFDVLAEAALEKNMPLLERLAQEGEPRSPEGASTHSPAAESP
jgi:hypothetical protein